MVRVQVTRVESKKPTKRKLYATICFYYGYRLDYVQQLPARDLYLLYNTAMREEARKYLNLVDITAAPHTEKGRGVSKLKKHYKGIMDK